MIVEENPTAWHLSIFSKLTVDCFLMATAEFKIPVVILFFFISIFMIVSGDCCYCAALWFCLSLANI